MNEKKDKSSSLHLLFLSLFVCVGEGASRVVKFALESGCEVFRSMRSKDLILKHFRLKKDTLHNLLFCLSEAAAKKEKDWKAGFPNFSF